MYQSLKPSLKGKLYILLILSIIPILGCGFDYYLSRTLTTCLPCFIGSELLIILLLGILEKSWLLYKIQEAIPKESYTKGKKGYQAAAIILFIIALTTLILVPRCMLHYTLFCTFILMEIILGILWQRKRNNQIRMIIISKIESTLSEKRLWVHFNRID